MYQLHGIPLLFYPLISYLQALDHSVTVVVVNTMFLLVLLSLQPIGLFLSKAMSPVWYSTGYIVGPTYSSFNKVEESIQEVPCWCCGVSCMIELANEGL